MLQCRIIFSPEAKRDLEEILDWVSMDSPERAIKTIERIETQIHSLRALPHRYVVVRAADDLPWPIHKLSVPPYKALEWIEEDKRILRVVSVQDGRRRSDD